MWMKVLRRLLPWVGLVLFTGCMPNPPLHQSLNEPGSRVDLRSHLARGKTNIVFFYADWCPKC
jgi:thiol-disulfide isomerase/thioredoxin